MGWKSGRVLVGKLQLGALDKLSDPSVSTEVIKRLAMGESDNSVGTSLGLPDGRLIRKYRKRDEIRKLIEQEQLNLVEIVPDAVENVKGLVRGMKAIPVGKETQGERFLAYKATSDTLKAVGIFPNPVQSQVITTYLQQNNTFANPEVKSLLSNHVRFLSSFGKERVEMERKRDTSDDDEVVDVGDDNGGDDGEED
jgi:hypothetical protein